MKIKKIHEDFDLYSIKNFYKPPLFQKQKLIAICWNNLKYKQPHARGYNWPICEDSIWFQKMYNKFLNYSKKIFNFHIDEKSTKKLCWCYGSTKDDYAEVWHDHAYTSTISAVYYLSIPGKTSIDFQNKNGKIINYKPEERELIIFPNILPHKPRKCDGEGSRISINMEIICHESSEELFSRIK